MTIRWPSDIGLLPSAARGVDDGSRFADRPSAQRVDEEHVVQSIPAPARLSLPCDAAIVRPKHGAADHRIEPDRVPGGTGGEMDTVELASGTGGLQLPCHSARRSHGAWGDALRADRPRGHGSVAPHGFERLDGWRRHDGPGESAIVRACDHAAASDGPA